MILELAAVGLLGLGYLATGQASDDAPAVAALARLRSLTGEWQGSVEWSGARRATGSMNAIYSLTGNGSAVVESLVADGASAMTSVYHLDGADLRMTHYCAAQNQPRMVAKRIDPAKGEVDFVFLDATNLSSPKAGHMHNAEIQLIDADHFNSQWEFFENGKVKNTEVSQYTRVR